MNRKPSWATLPAYATFTIVEHEWSKASRAMHEWVVFDNWGEICVRRPKFEQAEGWVREMQARIQAWGAPYDQGHR